MKIIAKYIKVPEDQATAGQLSELSNVIVTGEAYKVSKDRSDFTPVSLFAVTQDIKVGDEVVGHGGKTAIVIKSNPGKRGETIPLHRAKKANWVKVLGELSPDAIWIKDGDEIEVKESGITNIEKARLDPENVKLREFIGCRVLCPSCKTYH